MVVRVCEGGRGRSDTGGRRRRTLVGIGRERREVGPQMGVTGRVWFGLVCLWVLDSTVKIDLRI